MGLGVAADLGPGIVDVEQGAGRRDHTDGAEAARVLGDGLVGDLQDAVVGGGVGDAEGGIDRAERLRRGAGIVDHHLVALDVNRHLDVVGLVLDAVVLDLVLEAIDAVLDGSDLRAHTALGVVHQVKHVAAEGALTVFADELLEPALAHVHACNQRAQVAVVVTGGTDIREEQLPHLLHVLAAAHDLDRRYTKSFLEDLGRLARESARHHAADLLQMADRHGEAHELVIDEDRLDQRMLGAVQAAAVGVVVADHVAGLEGVQRDLLDATPHQQGHAADHGRAVFGLRDHLAFRARERAGEVQRLVEDRRIRRLHQDDAHLAADRGHGRIDDRHSDHVDVGLLGHDQDSSAMRPIRRLPY